jgi:peroxiredoxin
MLKKIITNVSFVILLLSTSAFSQQVLRPGSAVPQFSATSYDGVEYKLSDLRGKVVVLTFWSTRCPICRVEMPRLNELAGKYDPQRVVFLAMTAESEDVLGPFLRKYPFRFVTVPNSFGTLLQYADRDRNGFVSIQYPAFYVVGPDGRLRYRGSGYGKIEAVDTAIREATPGS